MAKFLFPILILIFTLISNTIGQNSNSTQGSVFYNPILDHVSADPSVVYHQNHYYLVLALNNILTVYKSPIMTDFKNAEKREIYRAPPGRANLWAPEIQYIRGAFYIYFTMDDGVADENHRMYVIHSFDPNDPMSDWSVEKRLLPDEELYAIDGNVMSYVDGRLYFIWTGFDRLPPTKMSLYIAPMVDPMTVYGPRILLRSPKSHWEMHGFPVNEGGYIIENAGRTFLVFSASSTFTPDYCLGIMGIDFGQDPLIASNWWNDKDECVFWRNDEDSVFGTGHASFVKSPDGTETWMFYHAVDRIDDLGVFRRTRIQKLDWNPDNAPRFPRPNAIWKPLQVPSGQV